MARAPVSKTEWFPCQIKAHSEKFAEIDAIAINSLVRLSECQRSFQHTSPCRLLSPITDRIPRHKSAVAVRSF
jgi:hypothetical protein